jgi:hypothetical protein
LQADKAYCSLTKKAAFGAQHNRQTDTLLSVSSRTAGAP